MTDWMLYEFARQHSDAEIQRRIDWLNKQGDNWLAELMKATDDKTNTDSRLRTADNQVKCYAKQAKELAELAHEFGKLVV